MRMALFQSSLLLLTASHPDTGVTAVNKVLQTTVAQNDRSIVRLGKILTFTSSSVEQWQHEKDMLTEASHAPMPLLWWTNRKSSGTALLSSREQLLGFTDYFLYLRIWILEATHGISSALSTSGLFFTPKSVIFLFLCDLLPPQSSRTSAAVLGERQWPDVHKLEFSDKQQPGQLPVHTLCRTIGPGKEESEWKRWGWIWSKHTGCSYNIFKQ